MATDADIESLAYDALIDAGFVLVQRRPYIQGMPQGARPDLVAWAVDESQALVPWVAVQTSTRRKGWRPDLESATLAGVRDTLGTRAHYAVSQDGSWHRSDSALRRFTQVDRPAAPQVPGVGPIEDASLVENLFSTKLWSAADRARGRLSAREYLSLVSRELQSAQTFHTEEGLEIPLSDHARWKAARRSTVSFTGRTPESAQSTSDQVVAGAVARLAGRGLKGSALDPFCGIGTFLWEAVDVSRVLGDGLAHVTGFEINEDTAATARAIAESAPVPTEVRLGNALDHERTEVDVVVSSPPLGTHLSTPRLLMDGSETRRGDIAYLDYMLSSLMPGGRAVVQLSKGFTLQTYAAAYREFLTREFRIAAVIGLPSGSVPGTAVPSVLLVVDSAPPGETFVAQLGEDWREQLAPGGAALEAATRHIDGGVPE